ncbi:MAG: hypothetical protein R2713_20060 [Ilumatobacteraceae bacterium]
MEAEEQTGGDVVEVGDHRIGASVVAQQFGGRGATARHVVRGDDVANRRRIESGVGDRRREALDAALCG